FRCRHALQHQNDGAPDGSDIDGLVRGVEHQHRLLQNPLVAVLRHRVSPAGAVGVGSLAYYVESRSSPSTVLSFSTRARSGNWGVARASVSPITCAAPARFKARAQGKGLLRWS